MKTSRILALAIAALSLGLAAPIVLAQDAPPPPPKGEREGPRKVQHVDQLKKLTEKLDLTADQQAKIKLLLDEQKAALAAVREDSSLDKDAKRAKSKETWTTCMPKIRALLTPVQQVKFDEMKEEMGRGPRGHKPPKDKAQE